MPIKVPDNLPAVKALEQENIFVMGDFRAHTQEIRPLKLAVLNLMPNKIDTETQLIRLLANNPLQIELVLLRTATYEPKTESIGHLNLFYRTLEEAIDGHLRFDGLIITGAPVERLDFSEVVYWDELRRIMDWAEHNVYSSLYICWAAQAALYYLYGIEKYEVPEKIFGIFRHRVPDKLNPLVRGFNDEFDAPHSRYTQVNVSRVRNEPDLDVLAESDEAGIYLAASKNLRRVFVFGHGEYDLETLHNEYVRDRARGLKTKKPRHYYKGGQVGRLPKMTWRAHESLLIANWLNYCVYQATPFDLQNLK